MYSSVYISIHYATNEAEHWNSVLNSTVGACKIQVPKHVLTYWKPDKYRDGYMSSNI